MGRNELLVRKLLTSAVMKNPASGVLLSGGLDSSLVSAICPPMKAITVTLNSSGKDLGYSKKVVDFLKMERMHIEVSENEAIKAIPKVVKILKSFDPAIPNDLVVYFGLREAKRRNLKSVMTGDGSDELFAGYSFMQEIDDLEGYIKRMSKRMVFSSNRIADYFGIKLCQPYLDKEVMRCAQRIKVGQKIGQYKGKTCGKWILRKAFEDMLPKDVIWQPKRPLEYGSGMNSLRRVIESKVSREEFMKNPHKIEFINREHIYYYKVYKRLFSVIPSPKPGEQRCPGCGTGLRQNSFHCRVCGHVLNSNIYKKRREVMKKTKVKNRKVIALRKKCKAKGTGLSHYILLDKK